MGNVHTGGWIQLRSGRAFDPLGNLEFDLEDLIHGVSHLCRFSGQTRRFYSVAEHTVRGAWLMVREFSDDGLISPYDLPEMAEWLVHDLHEALTLDVPRPFHSFLGDFADFERGTAARVRRLLLPGCPAHMSDKAKETDLRMLSAEAVCLMHPHACPPGYAWALTPEMLRRGTSDAELCGLSSLLGKVSLPPAYWRRQLRRMLKRARIPQGVMKEGG
jgi:hypothetical protein